MRINKEDIHMDRVKCVNTIQITLDDDFNVPDNKSDIITIVKEWGNVCVENIKVSGDKADISGCLDFALLYTGVDNNSNRCIPVCMSGSMNISETINLSEDGDNSSVTAKAKLEDITIKAINSRKVSIKAIVCVTVTVEEIKDIVIGTNFDNDDDRQGIQCLNKTINYARMAVNLHDTLRIKENVSIGNKGPQIENIIWNDVAVHNINSRLTDDGIDISGEITAFIMYMPRDDQDNPVWQELNTTFEGKLDINGCNADMISQISYGLVSKSVEAKDDENNENRRVLIEAVLDVNAKVYEECEREIIADAYCPAKKVTLDTKPAEFKRLIIRNNNKCKLQHKATVGEHINILQICNCTGEAQIDDIIAENDGLQIYGAVMANVFYITSDDAMPMGSLKVAVPFETKIQGEMTYNVNYNVEINLNQLSATMTGSREIEIKGSVMADVIMFEEFACDMVLDINVEEYEKDEYIKLPCIVGYIGNGKDTLWDVAKRFNTTVEAIKKINLSVSDMAEASTCIGKGEKMLLLKENR